MHKFLRSIGFSEVNSREDVKKLIDKTISDATERKFCVHRNEVLYGDYNLKVGEKIGLLVCGDFNLSDEFKEEFYFPYMEAENISTMERSSIERHAAVSSYGGVCEDNKIGISIIYYLQNRIDYIRYSLSENAGSDVLPVCLSGLSDGGMIMMPIAKDEIARKKVSRQDKKRDKLIKAAREGNEEAIESLTLGDLDVYSTISRKIKEEDIYSIVDTFFMPYGIECDQYSVMGEIEKLEKTKNIYTGEEIYLMTLSCNGLPIDICINKMDLFGEPEVGRRFKGTIWLQGRLETGSHS